jgi:hypothetical protein
VSALREALLELLGQFDQAHDALGVERSQSAKDAIAGAQRALAAEREYAVGNLDYAAALKLIACYNADAPYCIGWKNAARTMQHIACHFLGVAKGFDLPDYERAQQTLALVSEEDATALNPVLSQGPGFDSAVDEIAVLVEGLSAHYNVKEVVYEPILRRIRALKGSRLQTQKWGAR